MQDTLLRVLETLAPADPVDGAALVPIDAAQEVWAAGFSLSPKPDRPY